MLNIFVNLNKMKKVGVILARFQPIHNGHIELIKKASSENDEVLVFIGSIDKLNARNPIPWTIRKKLVETALEGIQNVRIAELADLSDENDNSHDWGFYLYANIVSLIGQSNFTIYYSDGYEIITSWFPGFLLRNNVSLSLLARNVVEDGVSATKVRNLIHLLDGDEAFEKDFQKLVPPCVYEQRYQIKAYLDVWNR